MTGRRNNSWTIFASGQEGCSSMLWQRSISISPSSSHIAAGWTTGEFMGLNIYDASTGKCLTSTTTDMCILWFTRDGREVWFRREFEDESKGWTIIEDDEHDLIKLEPPGSTAHPSGGFPWKSPRDHKVARQWVLKRSTPVGSDSHGCPTFGGRVTSTRYGVYGLLGFCFVDHRKLSLSS